MDEHTWTDSARKYRVTPAATYCAPLDDSYPPGLLLNPEPLRKELLRLAQGKGKAEAEVERLQAWLHRIDGGDRPCTDESQLRQWAYEAVTLNKPCPRED